jgi:Uri superfamily endonuclease
MNLGLLNRLPQVGVYALIIHLPANIRLKVGKLGVRRFPKGYYAYTGSALGLGASSLRERVARHLQKEKHKFWHIDYLLTREDSVVTAIVAAHTSKKLECEINRRLKNETTAEIPVLGFGASDCKEKCGSHLLYLGEKNVEHKVASLYNQVLGRRSVVVHLEQKSQICLRSNLT